MIYKRLGRTGLEISRLGFGAMRLPGSKEGPPDPEASVRVIHRAFELGVNYIDTAVMYCRHQSESVVGQALKGWRDRVYVSTKNHYFGPDEKVWWRNLENSLSRLDVDYIDVYHIHAINQQKWETEVKGPNQVLAWMRKAHDQGLIRHICCSFHGAPEELELLVDTGVFSSFTVQYNLLDRSLEGVFPKIFEHDMGLVIMGPVAAGRLGSESEPLKEMIAGAQSVSEVALRFVLANPYVTAAISGMNTLEQVEENCAVGGRAEPLSETERDRVTATLERFKGLSDLYCTGCKYCMPCPHGVDIPETFLVVNTERVYGLKEHAARRYEALTGKPTYCVACGACESKCPQSIPIRVQLREAAARFDPAYGRMEVHLEPIARPGADLQFRARFHNLADGPNEAKVRLSARDGLTVAPDRFDVAIAEPFLVQKETLVVRGFGTEPGVIRLDAVIEDAAGSREEMLAFPVGTCRRVVSMEALAEDADAFPPLAVDRVEQVLVGQDRLGGTSGLDAWTGFTPESFMVLVRVAADVTAGSVETYVDLVLDLRNRRGHLPPGYHENMWFLRLVDAGGVAPEVQVSRGELDTSRVALAMSVTPDGSEWRIEVPWEILGGYLPKAEAGFGFEIAVTCSDAGEAPVFRAGWSGHAGTPRHGMPLGTLFFAG